MSKLDLRKLDSNQSDDGELQAQFIPVKKLFSIEKKARMSETTALKLKEELIPDNEEFERQTKTKIILRDGFDIQ